MIKWIKKLFCEHNWYELSVGRKVVHTCHVTFENEYDLIACVFCPKCRKRKRITASEWELLCKEKEILAELKV